MLHASQQSYQMTHTRTHKSAADLYIYTPHAMNSMKWQDWAMLRAEEAMEWQR